MEYFKRVIKLRLKNTKSILVSLSVGWEGVVVLDYQNNNRP